MSVILVFPGQGSQKPGMAKDLADAFPIAKQMLQEVDDALGVGLSRIMFDGPAEELTATHNAQPALLAHGAIVWALIRDRIGGVNAAGGHSLGEHTAYHAAGSTTLADAVRIVRTRGELMHEAGIKRPGAMAAILGELTSSIEDICLRASETGEVVPANYNSDAQIVVSGEIAGVEKAMELAKQAGAKRAVRLPVAGAFHSPLMKPAEKGLREAIESASLSDPSFPVYSNVTTEACTTASCARDTLVRQLTSPVRWTGQVKNMAAPYPDATWIELGPGNVLTGLISRAVSGARALACGTPADIDKLFATIQ
ncbi:MAG TPA: ACP S-malonyltransferase [Gemmatimonadaceae bacterium]|nr:ACP S-malonyltransferase [Gemmatimonadaceae bacterium]